MTRRYPHVPAFPSAVFVALLSCAVRLSAQDTTFRGITINGQYDPRGKPSIVVLPVTGAFGDSIRAILQRDFDYSDRFTVVPLSDSDAVAVRLAGSAAGLNYQFLARLGVAAVLQVSVVTTGFHVALHDVARASVLNVAEFPTNAAGLTRDWRLRVHQVSDEAERWITGQAGIAASRIAYIRGGSIRIIDSDGADEITVPTEENGYRPTWNPNGSMLTYSTFGSLSKVYVLDLTTGRSRVLVDGTRNVTVISPVFSPNGQSVVYARAGERGTDLYSIPVNGGDVPTPLTVGHGTINSSPTFSPDGRRIVYESDRNGHVELYIMDSDGSNQDLLTNYDFSEKNWRADPDWTPDGRLVAYSERINGRFQIKQIPARGGTPKLLTSDGENQQPSWAPDSRHVVFKSDRSGASQLWVLDSETGRLRQLTKSAGPKLPAWSGRLAASPQ